MHTHVAQLKLGTPTSSAVKNPNDTDVTCAVVISLECRELFSAMVSRCKCYLVSQHTDWAKRDRPSSCPLC